MNKEKFLASGLLQQYALGLTDEQETEQVETYLEEYPELRSELKYMHAALDEYAEQLAIPKPPTRVRRHVKNAAIAEGKAKKFRYLSLFFLLLAALSISGNFLLYKKNQQLTWKNATSRALYIETRERLEQDRQADNNYRDNIEFLEHEATREVWLGGDDDTKGRAVVYWNPALNQAKLRLLDQHKFSQLDSLALWKENTTGHEMLTLLPTSNTYLQDIPFFKSCERVYLRHPDAEVAVISSQPVHLEDQ